MTNSRNDSLDVAKGIGILLVVLGHSMSPVIDGHSFIQWLYMVIYAFHMPLFFFVSGYVAKKLVTKPVAKTELLKQRSVRLMVPYCVWAIVYLPMKIVMADHVRFSGESKWYSFFLGNNPDGQLWFLYVLFVVSVFMILFVTNKNITTFTIMFMIVSMLAPFIPFSISFTAISLNFSLFQVEFFFLGTLLAVKNNYEKLTSNIYIFIFSIVAFVAYCVLLWINKNEIPIFQTTAAFCATYICLFLCNLIANTKAKTPFVALGKKTMEIYMLHGPLLVIGRIVLPKLIPNVGIYIITLSAISIVISLILSNIINKIGFARLLLFGSK